MIRHRQEAESVPTVSTISLSEPLTTAASPPRKAFLTQRKRGQSFLGTADRVVTPALTGTTLAWLTFRYALSVAPIFHSYWTPSVTDLLFAYCATLLIAFPIAFRKSRWHGWYAVIAAWIGTSLSLAYSYGSAQNARWPWPEDGDKVLYFAKQNFPPIAFCVLLSAVIWLPVVLGVYYWRKPLSERGRDSNVFA